LIKMPGSVAYLCVWSGNAKRALDLTGSRFPGMEIRELSYRGLRMSTFMQRIRLLRSIRGRAIIFYFASLDDFKHRQVLVCFHLLHRCQETVLCDTSGRWESIRNIDIARWAPGILLSLLLGFSLALALPRYDLRRELIVDEANAIGTVNLRAQLLPDPARSKSIALLREYVDARVQFSENGTASPLFAEATLRSHQLQAELWNQAKEVARARSHYHHPDLRFRAQ